MAVMVYMRTVIMPLYDLTPYSYSTTKKSLTKCQCSDILMNCISSNQRSLCAVQLTKQEIPEKIVFF